MKEQVLAMYPKYAINVGFNLAMIINAAVASEQETNGFVTTTRLMGKMLGIDEYTVNEYIANGMFDWIEKQLGNSGLNDEVIYDIGEGEDDEEE